MILYEKNKRQEYLFIPRTSVYFMCDKDFKMVVYQNSTQIKDEYLVKDVDNLLDYYKISLDDIDFDKYDLGEYEIHLFPYKKDKDTVYTYECVSSSILQIIGEREDTKVGFYSDNENNVFYE